MAIENIWTNIRQESSMATQMSMLTCKLV